MDAVSEESRFQQAYTSFKAVINPRLFIDILFQVISVIIPEDFIKRYRGTILERNIVESGNRKSMSATGITVGQDFK